MFPRFLILLFLLLLIFRPATGAAGASYGLSIWYQVILPTLLPFLILSNLMQRYQKSLSHRPWQIVLLGLLCGYPMGAKILADVSRRTTVSHPTYAWLLSFCNQASPMFLFSYLPQMLGTDSHRSMTLGLIVYLSAGIISLIAFVCYRPKPIPFTDEPTKQSISQPFIRVLEETMMNSLEIMVKIGLYMMLFSIFAYHLMELPILLPQVKCLLLAINEMTTGIAFTSAAPLTLRLRESIVIAAASFGGLSGFAQTCCVLRDSPLSTKPYFAWKLLQGVIAFIIVYCFL